MSLQPAVQELVTLGPLPHVDDPKWDITPNRWEEWINKIEKPVSDDDATALCGICGVDLSYGLGWSILYAIETAPSWPIVEAINLAPPYWKESMTRACRNAGLL